MDDDIFTLMKEETPYLLDDGFSDKVLANLPKANKSRRGVIIGTWLLAAVFAAVLWGSGGAEIRAFAWNPLMIFSVATFAFWAMLGFFAYVTVDEGIIDL